MESSGSSSQRLALIAAVCTVGAVALATALLLLNRLRHIQRIERLLGKAAGPIGNPPRTRWVPKGSYAAFLSHYKTEAGADARFIHDLLQRMLGCAVFLDSTDLVDLRALFVDGVHRSDVIVLLSTANVLTRPWCLLELYEAKKAAVPVIVVNMGTISGCPPRSDEWIRHFIVNIETELPKLNPWALDEVRGQLARENASIEVFKSALLEVLHLEMPAIVEATELATVERSRSYGPRAPDTNGDLQWRTEGTDNEIIADAQDLCCAMADAAGRPPLRWKAPVGHQLRLIARLRNRTSVLARNLSFKKTAGARFAFCISYDRGSSRRDARLLQSELARLLNQPVLVADAPTATVPAVLRECRALCLLQSKSVLHQPCVLLELFEAVRMKLPIVCVVLKGDGYNFEEARPPHTRLCSPRRMTLSATPGARAARGPGGLPRRAEPGAASRRCGRARHPFRDAAE